MVVGAPRHGRGAPPSPARRVSSAGFLLWPLLAAESGAGIDLVGRLVETVAVLGEYATTPAGAASLAVDAALIGAFLALWVRDGLPAVAWALGRHSA